MFLTSKNKTKVRSIHTKLVAKAAPTIPYLGTRMIFSIKFKIEIDTTLIKINFDFPFIERRFVNKARNIEETIPPRDNILRALSPARKASPKRILIIAPGNAKIRTNSGRLRTNIHFVTCLLTSLTTSNFLLEYSLITIGRNNCMNNSGAIPKREIIVNATP